MEIKDHDAERVGIRRGLEGVPVFAGVGGVVDFVSVGDEVGSVVRIGVDYQGQEAFVRVELFPGETFVTRLPYRVVVELDKNSLRTQQSFVDFSCLKRQDSTRT